MIRKRTPEELRQKIFELIIEHQAFKKKIKEYFDQFATSAWVEGETKKRNF